MQLLMDNALTTHVAAYPTSKHWDLEENSSSSPKNDDLIMLRAIRNYLWQRSSEKWMLKNLSTKAARVSRLYSLSYVPRPLIANDCYQVHSRADSLSLADGLYTGQ